MELSTQNPTQCPTVSKAALISGWVLCVLPCLLLIFSAAMKLRKPKEVLEGFEHLGYPSHLALGLGILELSCVVIYLIPQTAILGAILLTGYMGGVITSHLRIGEPWYMQALLAVVVWLGVFLREPRLRALIPLRRSAVH